MIKYVSILPNIYSRCILHSCLDTFVSIITLNIPVMNAPRLSFATMLFWLWIFLYMQSQIHTTHLICAITRNGTGQWHVKSLDLCKLGLQLTKCEFAQINHCIYCMCDILRTKHQTISRETWKTSTDYSERYDVSNRRQLDCLFNRLLRQTVKENTKILRYRFLCGGTIMW